MSVYTNNILCLIDVLASKEKFTKRNKVTAHTHTIDMSTHILKFSRRLVEEVSLFLDDRLW